MAGQDLENTRSIQLMLRVKEGDAEAFESLIEIHQHAVVGTVAKMLGNPSDAEDIAQQVFLRVWKSARRYEPKAKFTTWLFTITRNLVFNETRRRQRRGPHSSLDQRLEESQWEEADHRTKTPDRATLDSELFDAIDASIQALPEKQRLAVILRRYEEMPYEQIASILKTSVSSVKSLLFRARTTLKEELARYLEG